MGFREFEDLLEEDSPSVRVPSSRDGKGRPVVVVIDDDEMIRRSLRTVLMTRYDVRLYSAAQDGVTGVGDDVCAVILDVKMAGFDGFWACMQIRRKCPEVPVIFYSAYQDAKNPYDIINECHPVGYVVKDGSSGKLMSLLDQAVQMSLKRLENRRLVESVRKGRQEIEQSLRRSKPPPSGG
jgi:DNA-binding NtrC family response regulator